MQQSATINIDDLVDSQKITGFNWLLVFWCFVITLIDGYDISAAPAAGPFFVIAQVTSDISETPSTMPTSRPKGGPIEEGGPVSTSVTRKAMADCVPT
mgnify:CR=1 FL=1